MRAYGIEFKEGPDGFGVYASKDVEPLRRARVSFIRCFSNSQFCSNASSFTDLGCYLLVVITNNGVFFIYWFTGNHGNSIRTNVNHKPETPLDVFP